MRTHNFLVGLRLRAPCNVPLRRGGVLGLHGAGTCSVGPHFLHKAMVVSFLVDVPERGLSCHSLSVARERVPNVTAAVATEAPWLIFRQF